MAFLASWQEVSKAYGARPLFEGITLGVAEGERLGLIGPNGSGKSTLLRLLAGEETPDRGAVSTRRRLRMEYVPQEDQFPEGATVEGVLAGALADLHLEEHERTARLAIMQASCGLDRPELPVAALSGGGRKRLALARALIREPELLLLDEPTNHLDLAGILWLEGVLRDASFAYVLVSHDRYLLQNAAGRIVELNPVYPEGYFSAPGSYDDFLARRAEWIQGQLHEQQALESKVRREIEWLRQGAPARSTKEGARIRQAGQLMQELGELKRRNAQGGRTAGIDFDATRRKTRDLLEGEGIAKTLGGRTLFRDLDLLLSPGTRLGLIGPNGSGKSTLLKLLTGEAEPDRGRIRRAEGLRIAFFDQQRAQLDRRLPLRTALSPNGDTVIYRGRPMHVVAWAKRFLFRPEQLEGEVGYLSGGEQARVLIANLMLQPADLLILDEPTNDLDIPTLEVLEESLLEFPGALVLVTHDRFLLDRVSTDVLALDGRGGSGYFASYSQWERKQEEAQAAPVRPPARSPTHPHTHTLTPSSPGRLSTAERRELSRMEERIEKAEAEVTALQGRMADPSVAADHLALQETWTQLQAAEQRVVELYARWEELEGRAG